MQKKARVKKCQIELTGAVKTHDVKRLQKAIKLAEQLGFQVTKPTLTQSRLPGHTAWTLAPLHKKRTNGQLGLCLQAGHPSPHPNSNPHPHPHPNPNPCACRRARATSGRSSCARPR